jgi:hypothetical protein
MKTKDKVKYWLDKCPSLRDDDNRLAANIWSKEIDAKCNLFKIKLLNF